MGGTSWSFLLVGSFAAVGAAMTVGTLAALLRYHRTGTMPGSEDPTDLDRGQLVGLWARVAVGVVLTVIGVSALARADLLGF